jgi:homeodomain-containing protein
MCNFALAGTLQVAAYDSFAILRPARLVEHGLEAALTRKPQERPSHQPLFDGAAEAHRIALRCAEPPAGHARWPWRWLADTVVERDMVASASQETVRRTRKKPR